MATRILVVDDSPTIRSVVSTILERHGYEAKVAVDGQDAYDVLTSGEVKADLVLVDFVMPRLNGFQFCRALRENAALAETPVVLMSAKADRIREQFVQQTGAIDAITKPFDAQALVAVIENALRRVNNARPELRDKGGAPRGLTDLDFEDSTGVTSEAFRAEPPGAAASATKRTEIGQAVARKLAAVVTTTLASLPEVISPEELAKALEERLSSEAVLETMGLLGDGAPRESDAALAGDLAVVPIGAVLQLLQAENQTGVLVCRHGDAEVRATFREGLIDLVEASGAGVAFRLGRFFVGAGIVSAAEIEELTSRPASGSEEHKPLGMALLAAGKIDEAQLKAALSQQSNELLYEILRWPAGRFELRREPPSELAASARLAMPVASAVMEGFRRVDEWRALERTLGSFDDVLLRDDAAFGSLDVASLPAKEKAVLDAASGDRTVRAIVTASSLPSFDACRILVQLIEARVLRRRTPA
jgi:DNA-binding response OmpR family regulator